MTLAAGKLRHRIKIQEPKESRTDTGDVLITWKDVAEVWASVEPLSVREFIAGQAMKSQVTARIVVRYRPGLTAQMRILYRGKIYNPQGWLPDPESGLELLTAPCSEGTNDGR